MGRIHRAAQALKLIERSSTVTAETDESVTLQPKSGTLVIPARGAVSHEPRGLDAVYRAIQILETQARQLSVDVWRGDQPLSVAARPSFINKPSLKARSFGVFVAETVSSLAQRGNAFWRVTRHGYDVLNIDVLNPLRVQTWEDQKTSKQVFTYDGQQVPANDMCHLRLTHVPGEILGISPLQACARTIQGALRTQAYGSMWTDTAGAPPGILTTEQDLSPEQAERYKKQANETLQFSKGIAVLGKGLKYEKLLLTPAEIQFLDAQRNAVTQVARMFGIPPKMLAASVEGGSDTYSNAETENQQFVRQTLMAYLAEIEDALTYLAPHGQTVRFNIDGLLRSDTKTRYQAHAIGLAAGFITVDEVREIEGLPRLVNSIDVKEPITNDA